MIIFLLAGQVAVTTSLIDPRLDFNSNVLGCFNILESLRKIKENLNLYFHQQTKLCSVDFVLCFKKKTNKMQ